MRLSASSLLVIVSVLAALLTGFVLPAPTHASGGLWEAWLYDDTVGRVVRLQHDGVNTFQLIDTVLPADPGAIYSRNLAVSRDGRYLAYISSVSVSTVDGPRMAPTLRVFDPALNSVVATAPLPFDAYLGLDLMGSPYLWNTLNTQVAVGYGTLDAPDSWSIVVLDVPTNTPVMSLTGGTPIAASVMPGAFVTPVVQQFNDFTIKFTAVPSATDGFPEYPAFEWDFTGGATFANDVFVTPSLDQNVLGEAVMLLHDETYPGAFTPVSGFAVPNFVGAYNTFTGVLTPNYLFAENAFDVNFVQSGDLVGVAYSDAVTYEPAAVRVYTRGGLLHGEIAEPAAPVRNLTSFDGIVGGFIYTASAGTGRAGGTTLYRVYTQLGSTPPSYTAVSVWNSTLGANYRIMWVSDEAVVPSAPIEPWGSGAGTGLLIEPPIVIDPAIVLTPAVIDPLIIPTPIIINPVIVPTVVINPVITTPINPLPVGLRIGGQAMVQTTEGDPLNLRSGAGRSFPVIGQANHRDTVAILAGPQSADGFVWWQIQLPNGLVGWAVEAADGIQTLIALN